MTKIEQFVKDLSEELGKLQVITDEFLTFAYGVDASIYSLHPQVVVFAYNLDEVLIVMEYANYYELGITFRAAGTSLSGQASTDQVLVVLPLKEWRHFLVSKDGSLVMAEVGAIGAVVNRQLKPYNKKLGPDPASINSCTIGGMVANNASGMCCGVSKNSYHTLFSLRFALANGSVLDTAIEENCADFRKENKKIIAGIIRIRNQIADNPELQKFIKHKYRIKNTVGYSLNAFIDYHDPIEILMHLMVGSEGTLGFISEVIYSTVDDNPYKAVSLVYFSDLLQLTNLVVVLQTKPLVDAIELLDITSLKALSLNEQAKAYIPKLEANTGAMLIEISASNQEELQAQMEHLDQLIQNAHPSYQIKFTQDSQSYHNLWYLRRGIFPLIGANREMGSSVVIEDVAVDLEKLPHLVEELNQLFVKYNYANSAIFGHVLAGNIHFVFTPKFDTPEAINQYDQFMQEVANLVVKKYDGSLKAEHGTGRNMAPFVEYEWGDTLYKIMWQIKNLLDPKNILNPNVLLSKDPQIHLKDLKKINLVDPLIDKCIECGYCENVCPSTELTLSPRQRIAVARKINELQYSDNAKYKKYKKAYKYNAIDTCATTGLCAKNCPVSIDTGAFILKLKAHKSNYFMQSLARNYKWFIYLSRTMLKLAHRVSRMIGVVRLSKLTKRLNRTIPIIPVYLSKTPDEQQPDYCQPSINPSIDKDKTVLYIPSCSKRIFADNPQHTHPFTQVIEHLGYQISYPQAYDNLCCGQFFVSQGCAEIANSKTNELKNNLFEAKYKVIDNSSCANHLKVEKVDDVISELEFIYKHLDQLEIKQRYNKIALNLDCSSQKLHQEHMALEILKKCAKQVVIPEGIGCCGFAGTKGFFQPVLNNHALEHLLIQVVDCELGVTFNRNCQIGFANRGFIPYYSISELVLKCMEDVKNEDIADQDLVEEADE